MCSQSQFLVCIFRALNVTLVFQSKQQRFLRIGLAVPLLGTVASLRQLVAIEGKTSPDQVILVDLYPSGFQRSFSDDEDMNSIAEGDPVYAFQAPSPLSKAARSSGYPRSLPASPRCPHLDAQKEPGGKSKSSEFLSETGQILLLFCNIEGSGKEANRFGPPLLVREESTISWDQLQQSIIGKIYYLIKNDVHITSGAVLFHIRVIGGPANGSYLSPNDGRPLQHPAIDRALQLSGDGGPRHVKLAIEWDPKTKERLFGNIQEEVVQDAESVRAQQLEHQQQTCTLGECFQLYTKEEQLAPDDAWRCPHCKVLQQGTVKLSLWTLPDILIIHLKRFRQVGERRNKLSTLVKFPLTGLDMAPHVVKRSQVSKGILGQWPARKHSPHPPENRQLDVLYDLYAVCNHHGSLQGGHYTAYCRNSLDARWYSYDDINVEQILDEEVCTRGAYLLFYQKRNAIPLWSASSSVRGSTSSSVSDHWALRLSVTRRESLALRSTVNCINHLPSPEIPTLLEKVPDKGANGSKSFVRGVKGRSASMKLPSASKLKLSISKAMPLRWSFGSKDRKKRETGELVEYLESGRRPKFTSESIVPLMMGVPNGNKDTKSNLKNQVVHVAATGSGAQPKISTVVDTHRWKGKEKAMSHERTYNGLAEAKYKDMRPSGESYSSDTNSVLKGEKGDAMMRNIIKVRNMRAKPSEAEGQVNSTKQKPGLVQKEPRRQSGAENFVELPNGKPRISLSNGIPSGMDGRTSGTMPRQHKEDMTKTKLPADLRRAHSSSSVINKADWHQKRAESLYKNGNVSQQSSGQVTNEKQSASSLQRMRYHTSSLGRKKSVPESSF